MNKSSLGIHQVKLVVKSGPGLGNGSGVGEHANSSLNLGKVCSRNNCWRLIVDANLEASGAPVHKLDAPLGLDGGNSSINIFRHNISSIEHAASHVFSVARVALHHLVG